MKQAYAEGMFDPDSQHYFRRRAGEERNAADRALDKRTAELHRNIADEYERRANAPQPISPDDGEAQSEPFQSFRILP